MKIGLSRAQKIYNRVISNGPIDHYNVGSDIGLRQQLKQARNRMCVSAGATGVLATEAIHYASLGQYGYSAIMGGLGVMFGAFSKGFHSDLIKVAKNDTYKAIEKRASEIFGK